MNRFRLFLSTVTACFCMTQAAVAQDVALGLRANPDGAGATAKFFMDHNWAIEAQLNGGGVFDGPSFAAVALAEYHIDLPPAGWRLFFGGGLHAGAWDRYDNGNTQGIFGIDGIGGVEYVFRTIPLGLSADLKPAVNFAEDVAFFPNNFFGVAARFYLGRAAHHPPMRQRP